MRPVQSKNKVEFIRAPDDLSHHVKGLYDRVARRLGLGRSYVSQVARGERQSEVVEEGLKDALTAVVERANKQNGLRQRTSGNRRNRKKGNRYERDKTGRLTSTRGHQAAGTR